MLINFSNSNSNLFLKKFIRLLNVDSTILLNYHQYLIDLTALKESLIIQKQNLSSSKEYLRLKQLVYRTGKKLGKTPTIIIKKPISSKIQKKSSFDALRTQILDLKQKLVWEGVQLKLSPIYSKLKNRFYQLGQNLGLKATLKLSGEEIKYYPQPVLKKKKKQQPTIRGYLDLKDRIKKLKTYLKIQGVLLNSSLEYSKLRKAFYRVAQKVGFRPTLNETKFPTHSDILEKAPYLTQSFSTRDLITYIENYDEDAVMTALAADRKDDSIKAESALKEIEAELTEIMGECFTDFDCVGEKELVQLPVLSDPAEVEEKPSQNSTLTGSLPISYREFSKQKRLIKVFDRFDMVTMRIRSNYIKSNGFQSVDFNSDGIRVAREAAFAHFYECEPRYFNVENLLESGVFNDCVAGGSEGSSLAYAFFMKSCNAKATELALAKVAFSLSTKTLKNKRLFDQAGQSYSDLNRKFDVLVRAERVIFDQLRSAKDELGELNLAKLEGRPLPFYFED